MSTRLDYSVAALREQIELKHARNLEAAEAEYRESQDLDRRRDEWRARAEAAVRELHARLETARDNELESFAIPRCPRIDSYTRPPRRRQDKIEEADRVRDRAIGRLESVSATEDGTLSLTANMLRDWFSL